MHSLTHKTTILLSPEEHRFLVHEARKGKTTMGEMIRRAIRKLYFTPPHVKNKKAWNKLFRVKAPVSDWGKMETEILRGRLSA